MFFSCLGQNKTTNLNLQEVKLKDNELTKIISNICASNTNCFKKNGHYVLDFFYSSLSNKEFFLSMNEFEINNKSSYPIKYYVLINSRYFFISNKVPITVYSIIEYNKKFHIKSKIPLPGGDFNFLIYKTERAYTVLLNSCDE
jgi:hypothetical protein